MAIAGTYMRGVRRLGVLASALAMLAAAAAATEAFAAAGAVVVPAGRSELVSLGTDMGEIIVANPEVADVHVHSAREVSVIGKKIGRTNVRIFDEERAPLASFEVQVGYDLPAIRRALANFLPDETVAVEMVNTNIALTGEVGSAQAAEQAVKIVDEFMRKGDGDATQSYEVDDVGNKQYKVLNLLRVTSGQQVMLRVRVGELQRTAIKQLGINLSAMRIGDNAFQIGTGGGLLPFIPGSGVGFGSFGVEPDSRGIISAVNSGGRTSLGAMLEALETEGLFKVLAEPNLVAISGEKAEFLAGGEFPVPISEGLVGTSGAATVTVQYKPFGVAVQFTPYVLSESRIRIVVQPEVSELSNEGAVELDNFQIPALTTRRAKTTVEMAPGESFMIAGLISDKITSQVDQLPGLGEVPVLGALFRSTAFQRNETELVMAVTPYIVDPLKSTDIKLPTDNLQPASVMESFFYGALGTLSGDAITVSQTPQLEGPIGFIVD